MKIKLLCRSVIYLFGTFLHEFSHFTAALLVGKPEGFSVVPRIEGNSFIFGEVKARVRYKVLSVFIASAPLIWWFFLLLMAKHLLSACHFSDMQGFSIKKFLEKLRSFSLHDIFSLWLASQLLWTGRLSMQDIKTCFRGIISPSGFFLIALVALFVQVFRYAF